MREIKFRAWDEKEKKFFDISKPMYQFQKDGTLFLHKDFILLQYTGLKDKNGTEIYEGDIIKTQRSVGKTNIAKVIFNHGSFVAKYSDISNWKHLSTGSQSDCEVIGNIYSNSELLTNPL